MDVKLQLPCPLGIALSFVFMMGDMALGRSLFFRISFGHTWR